MKKIFTLLLFSLFTFHFSLFTACAQAPVYPADSCEIDMTWIDWPLKNNTEKFLNMAVCREASLFGGGGGGGGIGGPWLSAPVYPEDSCNINMNDIDWPLKNNTEKFLNMWVCRMGSGGGGGGTVTSVGSGFGLLGGPITTTGTLSVDTSSAGIATKHFVDSLFASIDTMTATNGLHINPTHNVKLGGTIIENTTIDKSGSDRLLKIQDISSNANPSIIITGGSAGAQVDGTGYALNGSSDNIPLWGVNSSSNNNTVKNGLVLNRTAVSGAAGMGINIQTNLKANILQFIGSELATIWTDASDGGATAKWQIRLTDAGTQNNTRLELAGSGQLTLSTYGAGTFTGTPTYAISTDVSGNLIETQAIITYKQAITALQAQTLNSAPIDIADLPAPGAGYAWEIITMSSKYTFVSADYTFTAMYVIVSGLTAPQVANLAPMGLGGADSWTTGFVGGSGGSKANVVENTGMQVSSDADDAIVGDGTFIVYGTARLIKL